MQTLSLKTNLLKFNKISKILLEKTVWPRPGPLMDKFSCQLFGNLVKSQHNIQPGRSTVQNRNVFSWHWCKKCKYDIYGGSYWKGTGTSLVPLQIRVKSVLFCCFFLSVSYHAVVQHSIGQWSVFGVLAVQVFTDHLDVGLLTHLLSRFHPKADVASVNKYKQ